MKKVIIFDLIGDYSHFRKYYTTTSPLTFLFPPRTAVLGVICAILGLKKDTWTERFSPELCDVGVQIIYPGRKGLLKENWRKGTARFSKRGFSWGDIQDISQIPLEVLRDARFRIYFSHKEESIFSEVKKFIVEHKSHFTPYLGLSEFICEIQGYDDVLYDFELIQSTMPSEILTVISQSFLDMDGDSIVYEPGKEYFEVTVPNHVDNQRQFDYIKVFFERNGKPIKVYLKDGVYSNKQLDIHIAFLR